MKKSADSKSNILALVVIAILSTFSFSFDVNAAITEADTCSIPEKRTDAIQAFKNCTAINHHGFSEKFLIPGQERVIFLGEQHLDSAPKLFIAAHADLFSSLGYTHLAVEFLNQTNQELADRLCHSVNSGQGISKEEFLIGLNKEWFYTSQSENYYSAFAAACAAGLKLIALDMRNSDQYKNTKDEREKNFFRDQNMAQRISQILVSDQNARVLVWSGALHALQSIAQVAEPAVHDLFGSRTLPMILKSEYGWESRSYRFESSLNLLNTPVLLDKSSIFLWAATAQNLDTGYSIVQTPRALLPFDGVLLMEQFKK